MEFAFLSMFASEAKEKERLAFSISAYSNSVIAFSY